MTRVRTLAVVVAVLAARAAAPTTRPPRTRRGRSASTGGAHHIQGFGAWQVVVEEDGRFGVAHRVRDEVKDYPERVLSASETEELWTAIDAADLPALSSSDRPGVPDEVQHTFALEREGGPPIEVTLWANDVRGQPRLEPILIQLRGLIETTTA